MYHVCTLFCLCKERFSPDDADLLPGEIQEILAVRMIFVLRDLCVLNAHLLLYHAQPSELYCFPQNDKIMRKLFELVPDWQQ